MSDWKTGWTIGLVRLWTRIYTIGLSPDQRRERQEEVFSDLWEHVREGEATGQKHTALQIVGRMLLGILDDLIWRAEQIGATSEPVVIGARWAMDGTLGRVCAGALLLLMGGWLLYSALPSVIRGFTMFEQQGAIAYAVLALLLPVEAVLTGLAFLLRRRGARLAALVFAPLLMVYGVGSIGATVFRLLDSGPHGQAAISWQTALRIVVPSTLLVLLGICALWFVFSKKGRGAFV